MVSVNGYREILKGYFKGKHFSGAQLCIFLGTGFNFAFFWVQLFLLFTLSPCAPRRERAHTRRRKLILRHYSSEEVVEIGMGQPSVPYEYRAHDEIATHARELYNLSCSAS